MDSARTLNDLPSGTIVYIAGPMTGYPNFNFGEFSRAFNMLRRMELLPINPADKFGGMQWLEHETYMRFSIAELLQCQAVYALKGADKSKGATAELVVAEALGLPVFRQTESISGGF